MTVDCDSHGEDRNARYEPREEEPGETNPDRKCARDRLPRYQIAITDREAGDESEIDRVADRPVLHKADQQTQGNLNRENCRQHRPRKMNGVAKGHEKAPPHALWCPTVHAYSYKVANDYQGFLVNETQVVQLRNRFEADTGPIVSAGGVR
jgi:hypothetical protein